MKINDIVELTNLNEEYKEINLYKGIKGIIIDESINSFKIIFFNEKVISDYAIVDVNKADVKLIDGKIPDKVLSQLLNFKNKLKSKTSLKINEFKEFDEVMLIVDKDSYKKHNVFKGMTGTIVDDRQINNKVLVDFGYINENNEYKGDCIAVHINDIILIK